MNPEKRPMLKGRSGTFGNPQSTNSVNLDEIIGANSDVFLFSDITEHQRQNQVQIKKITFLHQKSATIVDLKDFTDAKYENYQSYSKIFSGVNNSSHCPNCLKVSQMFKQGLKWVNKLNQLIFQWPTITVQRVQQVRSALGVGFDSFKKNQFVRIFENNVKLLSKQIEKQMKVIKYEIEAEQQKRALLKKGYECFVQGQKQAAIVGLKQKLSKKQQTLRYNTEFYKNEIKELQAKNNQLASEKMDLKYQLHLLKMKDP